MLPEGVRIVLLFGAIVSFGYILYAVRKAQMQIEYCIFWVFFGLLLVFFALFPSAVFWASRLIGFEAPSNFIFLVIILILMFKLFTTTLRLSKLDSKLTVLAQKMALEQEKMQEPVKSTTILPPEGDSQDPAKNDE